MQGSIPSVDTLSQLCCLEQLFPCLPPLTKLFETWETNGASHIIPTLKLREQVLGAATLPGTTLQLLFDVISTHLHHFQADKDIAHREKRPLHQRLAWHAATYSALETQAVLPPGVLVQKTVSVEMDGRLLLCTCVGAQPVTRRQLNTLAARLSLSRRASKRSILNPATCDPVREFEMLPGMVSPFLRPRRPTRLAALALLSWPHHWEEQGYEVAISLSLWESLLLPLRCLKALLFDYAKQAYPDLPVVELPSAALDHRGEQTWIPAACAIAGVTS